MTGFFHLLKEAVELFLEVADDAEIGRRVCQQRLLKKCEVWFSSTNGQRCFLHSNRNAARRFRVQIRNENHPFFSSGSGALRFCCDRARANLSRSCDGTSIFSRRAAQSLGVRGASTFGRGGFGRRLSGRSGSGANGSNSFVDESRANSNRDDGSGAQSSGS